MDTLSMNSGNSQTSILHVLILKLTNKSDLRIGENTIALSNPSIYYKWKNIKTHTIRVNLKYLHQHGVINFYLNLEHIFKNHGENTDIYICTD